MSALLKTRTRRTRRLADPTSDPTSNGSSHQFKPQFKNGRLEASFVDRLGRVCAVAEGFPTHPPEPTLMLGAASPAAKIGDLSRMDLNQTQVRSLLPLLQHFAQTGKLPAPETIAA